MGRIHTAEVLEIRPVPVREKELRRVAVALLVKVKQEVTHQHIQQCMIYFTQNHNSCVACYIFKTFFL